MPFLKSLVEIWAMGVHAHATLVAFGVRVSGTHPSVGDDDGVLDPDSAMTREVHAGLHRDDLAGGERITAVAATRGDSWMSRPTPWPVPWVKASPHPAASITVRQAASTSLRGHPGAHRGDAGGLATRARPRACGPGWASTHRP